MITFRKNTETKPPDQALNTVSNEMLDLNRKEIPFILEIITSCVLYSSLLCKLKGNSILIKLFGFFIQLSCLFCSINIDENFYINMFSNNFFMNQFLIR